VPPWVKHHLCAPCAPMVDDTWQYRILHRTTCRDQMLWNMVDMEFDYLYTCQHHRSAQVMVWTHHTYSKGQFIGKSKGTKQGKIRKQNKLRWNEENSRGDCSSSSFLCTIYIDNQANKLVFELCSAGCNCEPSLIKNQIIPRSLSKYYSKKSVYFDSIKKGTY